METSEHQRIDRIEKYVAGLSGSMFAGDVEPYLADLALVFQLARAQAERRRILTILNGSPGKL